jgi:hypothetical protein
MRRVLAISQRSCWPPPRDAVTSAGAKDATAAFAARAGTRPRDAALPFAWSTAATIDPWVDGASFFPRIFADVEAAATSVHILMIMMIARSAATAALLEERLFEPDIARSTPGRVPSGTRERLECALCDKLSFYL